MFIVTVVIQSIIMFKKSYIFVHIYIYNDFCLMKYPSFTYVQTQRGKGSKERENKIKTLGVKHEQ